MAAIVEGDFCGKARADVGDAEFRHEEIRELPGAVADGDCVGREGCIGEEVAVEDLKHCAAGTGADDDGVGGIGGELLDAGPETVRASSQ